MLPFSERMKRELNGLWWAGQAVPGTTCLVGCPPLSRQARANEYSLTAGANILRDVDGNIKLCDFGMAKQQLQSGMGMNSVCGTWYYMSPEVSRGDEYGCNTDIW